MNYQTKLLKRLRQKDHEEFDAPLYTYQPFTHLTWLDQLSNVTNLDEKDLHSLK